MAKLKKLTRDQWTLLDNMMQNVPDPNETYTATGWHYNLNGLLRQFGIIIAGRIETFRIGKKLWDMGYE